MNGTYIQYFPLMQGNESGLSRVRRGSRSRNARLSFDLKCVSKIILELRPRLHRNYRAREGSRPFYPFDIAEGRNNPGRKAHVHPASHWPDGLVPTFHLENIVLDRCIVLVQPHPTQQAGKVGRTVGRCPTALPVPGACFCAVLGHNFVITFPPAVTESDLHQVPVALCKLF